jgi:pyruvate dehydrogenase E2 component (dihydrolipoamide acetyltransferase)
MDLKLPPLGEGAESGTVVNLFVKEGDQIVKDQPVLELENEKAVATIPATAAGTVSKIFVKTGEKISVGQRILALNETAAADSPGAARTEAAPKAKETPALPQEAPTPKAGNDSQAEQPGEPRLDVPVAASPAIRKMAADLGIDLTRVRGTERGGRIILEDVRTYIQNLQKQTEQPRSTTSGPSTTPAQKPAPERIDFAKWGAVTTKPLSPLRQVIARRMLENWNTIPHVTQFDQADITDLIALIKKHSAAYEQKSARLTLTALALKIVVDALKKHPQLNSSLDEAAQEIVLKEYYHFGIAVDTEAGLIVPVLRDVDKKNLVDLARELAELATKARERKVSAEELKGGTFTISNQGGVGGGHFTPIVNKPEVAILGLGRGSTQAVVRDNQIQPRTMLPIALSYDHRVIDGAAAARFIVDLVQGFQAFREEQLNPG